MTQKVKILKYLMKHEGMTNGDGMRKLMINYPHKRVSELIEEGIRISREQIPDPYHKGGTMTYYRLTNPEQPEIIEFLTRRGHTL